MARRSYERKRAVTQLPSAPLPDWPDMLRQLRGARHSMTAIARVCDVERSTLYNIEAGAMPHWATGNAIIRLFQQELPGTEVPY